MFGKSINRHPRLRSGSGVVRVYEPLTLSVFPVIIYDDGRCCWTLRTHFIRFRLITRYRVEYYNIRFLLLIL